MYELRELTNADAARIAEIFTQAITDGDITLEAQAPSWSTWDAAHLPYCRFGCYDNTGLLVGYCALRPYSSRVVYSGVVEVTVYVDRDHQGLGIGSRLLDAIIGCADEHDVWTLGAVIFEKNSKSIRLFNKHGFRTIGVRERIGKDAHGQWQNIVLVERRSTVVGND